MKRKLKVIKKKKKKITSISSEILGKCASGTLISMRPLCPVDDASDRSSNVIAWEFLLAWFQRFLEREEGPRVLTP